jgi:hypothetical protein
LISSATFRQDYREFGSLALYPNSTVQYWVNVAGMLISNTARWGNGSPTPVAPASTIIDVAQELFVAHNLALEKQATDAAKRGGTPGIATGMVSSKSVGGASISYDTGSIAEEGAGIWNATTYGLRLYRLFMYFGAGAIQVGAEWDQFEFGVTPGAFVPATGTISLTQNPANGTWILLGSTKVTFVTGAPGTNQVQIGDDLPTTMTNLIELLDVSQDNSIAACNYALTIVDGDYTVNIAYKEVGPSGNTFAIGTNVAGASASGATLVGPIFSNVNGFQGDPWYGPDPWPGQTSFG